MRLLSPMTPLTGCYPRWLLLPIWFLWVSLRLDWQDRTVGLGPDWTGLILVRSSLEFWDWTVVQSPKKLGLDRRAVRSIFSGPDCLQSPKKLGPDCVAVQSQFLRLNGPSLGEKDQTGL